MNKQEVSRSVGQNFDDFSLFFEWNFGEIVNNQGDNRLEMGDLVIFIGEQVLESIFELLEIDKMIHFELEQSEQKLQQLDD